MLSTYHRFLPLLVLESSSILQLWYIGRSRIQGIANKTTSRSVTEVQRQRNVVGIRSITSKKRNAGAGKRRGARKRS